MSGYPRINSRIFHRINCRILLDETPEISYCIQERYSVISNKAFSMSGYVRITQDKTPISQYISGYLCGRAPRCLYDARVEATQRRCCAACHRLLCCLCMAVARRLSQPVPLPAQSEHSRRDLWEPCRTAWPGRLPSCDRWSPLVVVLCMPSAVAPCKCAACSASVLDSRGVLPNSFQNHQF